jgi:hypothetical protein
MVAFRRYAAPLAALLLLTAVLVNSGLVSMDATADSVRVDFALFDEAPGAGNVEIVVLRSADDDRGLGTPCPAPGKCAGTARRARDWQLRG